ncbi:mdj1 protein precursor [Microbotryomycetes sp. JL201]|nr:mdj1 protein precursor [Microbotryomycetes sp. JL201]
MTRLARANPLTALLGTSAQQRLLCACQRRTWASSARVSRPPSPNVIARDPRHTQRGTSQVHQHKTARRSFHSSARLAAVKDPYGTLGVNKEASTSEIKRAYYQASLAKKYHPDSNKDKGAKEKFVEIQEAYDILSDDKKRSDWDRFGPASTQQGFDSDAYQRASSSFGGAGFGDFFGGGGPGGASGADIFESLFGAFGGGARAGTARPGQAFHVGDNIEISVTLPFHEAAKGTTRTVNISPVVECKTCKGSGLKEGAKKSSCRVCGGSGTRTFTIQSGFQMASTCNACGGSGTVVPEGSNCGSCSGVGRVRERKQVQVQIPAGVDEGMKIRIDGEGDAPIGGKGRTGDLYVRVNVAPSKTFTRQGTNLYQNVSVPFYTAILGGRARVATLDRDVEVKVPGGTQPGEELVLRGRGIKKLYKNEFGDLIVRFNINMPRALTPAQRRILEQFVQETEVPGSTAFSSSSMSTTPPNPPPSPPPQSSEPPSQASSSPGFESQSAPPPRDDSTGANKWWSTMEGDPFKKPTPKYSKASTKPADSGKSEPRAGPGESASAAAAPRAEADAATGKTTHDGDDHSFLGDVWKAGKEKIKEAVGCDRGKEEPSAKQDDGIKKKDETK